MFMLMLMMMRNDDVYVDADDDEEEEEEKEEEEKLLHCTRDVWYHWRLVLSCILRRHWMSVMKLLHLVLGI